MEKCHFYRSGAYEIQEADGVQPGTKIVLHLKQDCREFSDEDTVSGMSPIIYITICNETLHGELVESGSHLIIVLSQYMPVCNKNYQY